MDSDGLQYSICHQPPPTFSASTPVLLPTSAPLKPLWSPITACQLAARPPEKCSTLAYTSMHVHLPGSKRLGVKRTEFFPLNTTG